MFLIVRVSHLFVQSLPFITPGNREYTVNSIMLNVQNPGIFKLRNVLPICIIFMKDIYVILYKISNIFITFSCLNNILFIIQ